MGQVRIVMVCPVCVTTFLAANAPTILAAAAVASVTAKPAKKQASPKLAPVKIPVKPQTHPLEKKSSKF